MAHTALECLTRDEIGRRAPAAVAVLPTAAIEQHGPHNPVGLDTMCCMAIAQGAAEEAGEVDAIVSPPLHYGSSDHHRPFPGVLSLRSGTFAQVLYEIIESLTLAGFRRVLIINGHGGNTLLVKQVAGDFVLANPSVRVIAGSYWDIARKRLDAVSTDGTIAIPGHGGDFETSLMLFLHPDLVRTDLLPIEADPDAPLTTFAPPGHSVARDSNVVDVHSRSFPRAWSSGLSDSAGLATRELGGTYYKIAVEESAALLRALVD